MALLVHPLEVTIWILDVGGHGGAGAMQRWAQSHTFPLQPLRHTVCVLICPLTKETEMADGHAADSLGWQGRRRPEPGWGLECGGLQVGPDRG